MATRTIDIPLGPTGLGAMAIVGGLASMLGASSFWGFDFLAYWQVLAGWGPGLASGAIMGTFIQCLAWNEQLLRPGRFLPSWRPTDRAALAAGIIAVVAVAYGCVLAADQCLLIDAPLLPLIALGITLQMQKPILLALRNAGRPRAVLAALLVVEAGIMFSIGESMSADWYRKGLRHYQTESSTYWPSSPTSFADIYLDFAQHERVLRTRTLAGDPVEVRRPLPAFACR